MSVEKRNLYIGKFTIVGYDEKRGSVFSYVCSYG
jgi:hypothetical protein